MKSSYETLRRGIPGGDFLATDGARVERSASTQGRPGSQTGLFWDKNAFWVLIFSAATQIAAEARKAARSCLVKRLAKMQGLNPKDVEWFRVRCCCVAAYAGHFQGKTQGVGICPRVGNIPRKPVRLGAEKSPGAFSWGSLD